MSSPSRPDIPCSRARARMLSTNPCSRSWISSGEIEGLSSSRSWLTATKHSEVISLILSIDMVRSDRFGNRQQLDLHPGRIEGRGQVNGEGLFLHDRSPELALQVQQKVRDAGPHRDLRRWPVGHLDGNARGRRRTEHLRQLRLRGDLAEAGQLLGDLVLRHLRADREQQIGGGGDALVDLAEVDRLVELEGNVDETLAHRG